MSSCQGEILRPQEPSGAVFSVTKIEVKMIDWNGSSSSRQSVNWGATIPLAHRHETAPPFGEVSEL